MADNGLADRAKFYEEWEAALYGPAPDLRLYAFRKVERGLPYEYDSGFMAVMGSIGPR
jgi:hypothetical protein